MAMNFVIAAISDVWQTFNMELAIFVLTLAFAYAIRGAGRRAPKQLKDQEKCQGVRSPRPAPRTPPPRPQAATRPELQRERRQPGKIMDEVVESVREQPGTRYASRALELYVELRETIRRENLNLSELARGARHSPTDFYNTLVLCVMRLGKWHLVENLIDDMIQYSVPRPLAFYESTMKQLAGQKHYDLALNMYDRLVADGLEPSAVTCSCLISFAAEVGEYQRAAAFFEKLASLTTPSIRAYMTVLRVHGRRQDWPASLATFRDMQKRGVQPDSLVLNVILATGISADQVHAVEALVAEADGYTPRITDVVSYNTLVKGYAQHNDFEGALNIIKRMRARSLVPNAITFNSVMDAAVRSQKSADAWNVLEVMQKAGLKADKYTCSIMVKGLVHCPTPKQVQGALDLLYEVDSCDKSFRSSLYHAIIDAAAQAGDSSSMMRAFSQMRHHRIVPTASAYRRLHELADSRGAATAAPGLAKGQVASISAAAE
eukprot:CAMPEP_0168393782 /NCGR_PEP_ID=MMETSP0228-20121227/19195_1 /TAXON_ID=133427 /ORGANISM="Protoceratium reticulatum, Strain CCCM 535 (=CCMP 1889)" /LENGTH=489 /DNA_ID=CAMNT_0008407173 /DNA_START=109 /DNA_END=1575 /DNA_ORIENTATION=-